MTRPNISSDPSDVVIKILMRAHSGDPWHGPSLTSLLSDLSVEEARWHPGAGAHSVWETVLHMRSWTREVERRALGGAPSEPVEGDWPPVTDMSADAWSSACASLVRSHESLIATIRGLPLSRLAERVGATTEDPGGSGITHEAMLSSLADHDIYHSGQISLLKRLARASLSANYGSTRHPPPHSEP